MPQIAHAHYITLIIKPKIVLLANINAKHALHQLDSVLHVLETELAHLIVLASNITLKILLKIALSVNINAKLVQLL